MKKSLKIICAFGGAGIVATPACLFVSCGCSNDGPTEFTNKTKATVFAKQFSKPQVFEDSKIAFQKILKINTEISLIKGAIYNWILTGNIDIVGIGKTPIIPVVVKNGNYKGTISVSGNLKNFNATITLKTLDQPIAWPTANNKFVREATLTLKNYAVTPLVGSSADNLVTITSASRSSAEFEINGLVSGSVDGIYSNEVMFPKQTYFDFAAKLNFYENITINTPYYFSEEKCREIKFKGVDETKNLEDMKLLLANKKFYEAIKLVTLTLPTGLNNFDWIDLLNQNGSDSSCEIYGDDLQITVAPLKDEWTFQSGQSTLTKLSIAWGGI